ncbi:alpha/beta fold hydrolase [Corallococcus praedator]|uniref:Alpha/beta fold hydrolase n=1 Tax=Corallococcus praedator TaxID=2316724 RepID=A0ABX9QPG1_9BACT|nr:MULTISPECIES: alpha/beta fold hydrolase [Corallococcus]RKH18457.1 alpha/beta fold hydrolase [Corallococcus sp. CA047B]RKH32994.1 alpha/beta fold hydrolase [Corallococcus sp. CA031C]RKI13532.1 alpha/beta fold hydrolase [Corallococcus praedator]
MPMRSVNGTRLYFEDTGGTGDVVLFSHGLLWSTRLFDPQVEALRGRFRCISYDHRGQGQSEVPPDAVIDMETVYADAVALIESLGVGPVHFVGLSMGGFVGMRLAARRPDLVRSLVLLETSADPEPTANIPRYTALNLVVRYLGVAPVTAPVMRIMFGTSFLTDPGREAERALWRARLRQNRRDIWRAVNGVMKRQGVAEELPRIRTPTLVIVGEEDRATVPVKSERIHSLIPGSKLVRLSRGGHSSSVEEPALVNAELAPFLTEHASTNAAHTG